MDLADNHTVFLLFSEFSLFRGFYARNWPLLSPAHGFVTLALAMVVLGINVVIAAAVLPSLRRACSATAPAAGGGA